MKKLLTPMLAFGLAMGIHTSAFAVPFTPSGVAPVAVASIDGQIFSLNVFFDDQEQRFVLPNQRFEVAGVGIIQVSGSGNPDPSLTSMFGATDLGDPSTFGMLFFIPIAPTGSPNTVTASIVGGLTDASGGVNGVTLTPQAPIFLPSDGDSVNETLVSAVGFNLGAFANMGVDVGQTVGETGLVSVGYGPFSSTRVPPGVVGANEWIALAHEYSFQLSGGGDAAALTGFTSIEEAAPPSVPEPASLLLLGSGLAGLGLWARKRISD